MRIAVTAGGGPAGTTVIEHLARRGHWVGAVDIAAEGAGQTIANACAVVPAAAAPGYLEALVAQLSAWEVDVLVVTTAEELAVLASAHEALAAAGTRVLMPPAAAIAVCQDKLAFARTLEDLGIPHPPTSLVGETPPPGPWISKPRVGRGSRGVVMHDDEASLPVEADDMRIVQQRLVGREFTVDFLADTGSRVVASAARWRLTVRGGISASGQVFTDAEVDRLLTRLVRGLRYVGPGNAQGFVSSEGDVHIVEVNPRFSGGLGISLAAGADLVGGYLRLASGLPAISSRVTPGAVVNRYFAPAVSRSSLFLRPGDEAPVRRRLLAAFGTRPEVVKFAGARGSLLTDHDVHMVYTGQHGDGALGAGLATELGVPLDESWTLPSADPQKIGSLVTQAIDVLERQQPEAVVVLGDTATVPVFALAAIDRGIPLVHVEAGLRSYNPLSREEGYRRMVGAAARVHFAPTQRAAAALLSEGVPASAIAVVGNPGLDPLAQSGVERVPVTQREGILVTAHRPTSVDARETLLRVVEVVEGLTADGHPVTFPVHPRTRDRLRHHALADRLAATGATITDPLGYRDLVDVLRRSTAVVTDSGGLQEEAAWFGVPTVIIRGSTPRWEGLEDGFAVLAGLDAAVVRAHVATLGSRHALELLSSRRVPFGDGTSWAQISRIIGSPAVGRLLQAGEPDFVGRSVPLA
ncbi:UDP-N-acetylglucosamine 2-epimerase [Microbacterium paraoxydans]|uniref:UDP-N-acetylglucosamine 2-epimerase n=2 Tax=Microbacterium TaxID=33882 RepID=UPI001359546D|nr:UDP-N-acetylglucosamine 2-epimerase [Microbacterium paraoxydans]